MFHHQNSLLYIEIHAYISRLYIYAMQRCFGKFSFAMKTLHAQKLRHEQRDKALLRTCGLWRPQSYWRRPRLLRRGSGRLQGDRRWLRWRQRDRPR